MMVGKAWLVTVYTAMRMYRLAPVVARSLAELDVGDANAVRVFGSAANVADVRLLAAVHNTVQWERLRT